MVTPHAKEIILVRCLKCQKIIKCSRFDTAALLAHIRSDHPEVDIDYAGNQDGRRNCSCIGRNYKSQATNSKSEYSMMRQDNKNTDNKECEYYDHQPGNEENAFFENEEGDEPNNSQAQFAKDVDSTHYSVTSEILEKYPEIKDCECRPRDPNANVIYIRRYKVNTPTVTASISTIHTPQKRNLYRTSIEKWRPANGTIYCPKCCCAKRPLIKTRAERFSYNQCGACCLLSCWPFCFLPCLLPGQDLEYLHCSNCKNFLGLYDRNTNCIKPNRLYVNEPQQPQEKADGGEKENIVNTENVASETNTSSKDSFGHSTPTGNQTKQRLPSIVIDGKELPPDVVARLQKFKKFGSLAGIDFDALTDKESPNSTNRSNSFK